MGVTLSVIFCALGPPQMAGSTIPWGVIMPTGRALLLSMLALGCVPDGWTFSTKLDAGGDVPAVDVGSDVPVIDVGSDLPVIDAGSDVPFIDVGSDLPPVDVPGVSDAAVVSYDAACVAPVANVFHGDGNANDATGRNNGSTSGGVTFGGGRFGQAFVIDGEARYVSIPAAVGNFGTGDFTIALWFNSTHAGVMLAKRAACWNGPPGSGEDIDLTSEGYVAVEVFNAAGSFATLRSPAGFNDGEWHFAALLRRGNTVVLDVDGADVASMAFSGSFDDPSNTPTYLGVGRCVPDAPGNNGNNDRRPWFRGQIDEVSFIARALSSTELLAAAQGRCVP